MKSFAHAPNPFMSAQPCFDRISSVQIFFFSHFHIFAKSQTLNHPRIRLKFLIKHLYRGNWEIFFYKDILN